MVFFELTNIELMIDKTHDPIGDFINALSADVVNHASAKSYEDLFVDTRVLSDLDTYPELVSRARRIGYNITKVSCVVICVALLFSSPRQDQNSRC